MRYNDECMGERSEVTVELPGGVRMKLHCENDSDYGHHWRHYNDRTGEYEPGTPHFSALRLNDTRIEFEWPEEGSTND